MWTLVPVALAAPITSWVDLGPLPTPPPVGAKAEPWQDLADACDLDLDAIRPGAEVAHLGGTATWGVPQAAPAADQASSLWSATWIHVPRFGKGKLKIRSATPAAAWLDGHKVALAKDDAAEGEEVVLTPGTHRLVVRTVAPPGTLPAPPTVDLDLPDFSASDSPRRGTDLTDVLDVPSVTQLALSADGSHLLVGLKSPTAESKAGVAWTEIRDARSGDVVATFTGVRGLVWMPETTALVGISKRGDEDVVKLIPVRGQPRELYASEHIEGVTPLPKGRGHIVTLGHPPDDADRPGGQRLRGTPDRWPDYRDRSTLTWISPTGQAVPLTVGDAEWSLADVSPDGRRALVASVAYDTHARPYSETTYAEIDLATLALTERATFQWVDTGRYLPDGRLLFRAGASSFGDKVGEGFVNDYDSDWMILDGATTIPLTHRYDPSIVDEALGPQGALYGVVEDEDYVRLVRWDERKATATPIDLGGDVVAMLTSARLADVVAATTASPNRPTQIAIRTRGRVTSWPISPQNALSDLTLGRVDEFDVALPSGDVLHGRLHLPHDFNPAKQYPTIVYYYGGTNPVSRQWGGRYPIDVWTAHGYVVYIPQPSGATGFGPKWSARHVGDWGARTSDEVIAGIDALVRERHYVDGARLGAIGASYGGFLTMTLLTKTDRFRAAVAHAGISNLASYWGEGFWGHLYSSVASGDSVPWNDPDLYVGHSPLFRADAIKTPLLLTHGIDDTNVPKGESDSLYTALRILGRDVEYVRFDDEDHWIVERDRRLRWSQTLLAWFDWKLKDEPDWFEHLWPSAPKPEEDERPAE